MVDKLKGVIPDFVLVEIPLIMDKYLINSELRLSHFLGQAAEESMNFTKTSENLNYSEDGLNKIFPSHFPNGLAANYARQPEKIANRVYANRGGNGDENSGDGWKYRGRGAFELTEKDNYVDFRKTVVDDVVENPDLVATKYFLESAAWFWNSHQLNEIADLGIDNTTISTITKIINGGLLGLSVREANVNKFYNILK